ncbi:hypothetical protein ACOJBM_00195 [Rhizobium beringeri]
MLRWHSRKTAPPRSRSISATPTFAEREALVAIRPRVQQWKAVGNKLADLSSADLSQYAYACAKHREWKRDCETDPVTILKRLGIEGY